MKKILILYTSVGLGHKTIAENIAQGLESSDVEIKLADIGKVQSGRFETYVVTVHKFINKFLPFVWSFLYSYGHFLILPFRTLIAGFNYKQTKKLVDEFRPDLIITTQTTASAVINFLKQKKLYGGLFGIAFSDFHLHRYWLYEQADFYLANITEQKDEMVSLGISAKKIFVCGMNLPKIESLNNAKTKFGISPEQKVILVASGSLGLGLNKELIEKLAKERNVKVMVVCGKNQQEYEQLKSNPKLSTVIILPFYSPMAELYKIADVFVSKPGGLSTAEALQFKLPIAMAFALPGQEKLNYEYLLKYNLVMPKSKNLLLQITKELTDGEFKNQLKNNPYLPKLLNGEVGAKEAIISMFHIKT